MNSKLQTRKAENLEFIKKHCAPLFVDYSTATTKISPDGITIPAANEIKAFGVHRAGTTVEQYLFSRYKRTLEYSNLPCISVYRGTRKSMTVKRCGAINGSNYHYDYYPIECLRFYNKSIAKASQKGTEACSSNGKTDEKKNDRKKYKKNTDKLTTEFTDKLTFNIYHDKSAAIDSSTDDDDDADTE